MFIYLFIFVLWFIFAVQTRGQECLIMAFIKHARLYVIVAFTESYRYVNGEPKHSHCFN